MSTPLGILSHSNGGQKDRISCILQISSILSGPAKKSVPEPPLLEDIMGESINAPEFVAETAGDFPSSAFYEPQVLTLL